VFCPMNKVFMLIQISLTKLIWAHSSQAKYLQEHNILEPTTGITFFKSGSKSDPIELFPSLVLVIAGEKRFPPLNFNLKVVRFQCGGGSWMLLDALLHC
jgi:hypothetical protein